MVAKLTIIILVLVTGTIHPLWVANADDPTRPRLSLSAKTSEWTRVIASPITIELRSSLQARGCQIIHELIDGLAVSCPRNVATSLLARGHAVEDKVLTVFDLESDAYINADDSWSSGFNGTNVKVAVLDTGVDATHPELAGSILASRNFAPGRNEDAVGHGTHVIGIVTANGGRQITGGPAGLADPNEATGAAPGAFILSGRVCRPSGCFTSDVEAGIEWAVSQGAGVINLSLGGGNFGGHCDSDRLAAKANWAVSQGVVVVASSGNDASGVSSPACGSSVIAVGATYQRNIGLQDYSPTCTDETTAKDQIVCFSNTGSALDLVAPGAGILSTYSCVAAGDCSRTWYAWGWGTSQAAPHVTAVSALILSVNQSLTPSEVKLILQNSARDLGPTGRDNTFGWGLVDALGAIAMAGAPTHRDLTVSLVVPSRTIAYSGANVHPIPIQVRIGNQGDVPESSSVSVLANASVVSSMLISNLDPNQEITLDLTWNTSAVPVGIYSISGRVDSVPGEIDLDDNLLVDGVVEVRKVGDVDGDGDVDIDDLTMVFLNQFTFNLVHDVDQDGDVDIEDLTITFLHQFT